METATKNYLNVEKLESWQLAFKLSNNIWDIAIKWDFFAKDTVGKQMVRSADSVSANIAEGFGRYGKKDKIRFYKIAMASLKETEDWLKKCKHRNLITEQEFSALNEQIEVLPKSINSLIKFTNEKLSF